MIAPYYINRFHGWSIELRNGLKLGFNWIHGNGKTSKTSAVIAAFHHPESITWRWALDWIKPVKMFVLPSVRVWNKHSGSVNVTFPIVGGFTFRWQQHMWRHDKETNHV